MQRFFLLTPNVGEDVDFERKARAFYKKMYLIGTIFCMKSERKRMYNLEN